jgi:hypothetical protein
LLRTNQREYIPAEDFAMAEINKKEHWAELYRRALFEEDRNKLPLLLEQAHDAVQQRVRELWYSPTHGQNVTDKERNELHTAAYYLGLLRSLEFKKDFGEDPIATNKAAAAWLWTSET